MIVYLKSENVGLNGIERFEGLKVIEETDASYKVRSLASEKEYKIKKEKVYEELNFEPKTVKVSLTVEAEVTVTEEVLAGIRDQYHGNYTLLKSSKGIDFKEAGTSMLYASLSRSVPESNEYGDDYWDGVANMKGLIKNISVSED